MYYQGVGGNYHSTNEKCRHVYLHTCGQRRMALNPKSHKYHLPSKTTEEGKKKRISILKFELEFVLLMQFFAGYVFSS